MRAILYLSCIFSWLFSGLAWLNLRTMLRPATSPFEAIADSVEILIPARNEESVIQSCVTSALGQTGLTNFKVTVLDDGSTDKTLEVLSEINDSRLKVLPSTTEPPSGWLGKTWACARLAEQSTADYLVFIDADVELKPEAVARSIELIKREQLALVSPYPRQQVKTPLARLVQPLLQWSWLSTVPLKVAAKTTRKSLAVANGQFIVCSRVAYLKAGGHTKVAKEVLDDIMLLRAFYESGQKGTVVDGTHIATCLMYETDRDLIAGYSKSLWRAFNGLIGSVITNAFLFAIYVYPLSQLRTDNASLSVIALLGAIYGRWIVAVRTRQKLVPDVFLHPLSILAFNLLNLYSWVRHLIGRNEWKGRSV